MNQDCKKTIEVLNLNDGEKVNHAILLLKGRLYPYEHEKNEGKEGITAEQLQPDSPQVHYSITTISRKGILKLLIDLRNIDKDNGGTDIRFTLQCGEAQRTIYFKFEKQEHLLVQHYYKLQPLLIQCVDQEIDREEQNQQQTIIDLNIELVKCIYADRLRSANFGRKIFTLNGACRTFETKLTCAALWQLSDEELWQHIAGELLNSTYWQNNLKFIAFISCTHYNGALRSLRGHVALGTGGLALFSTAHFYAWPSQFTQIQAAFTNLKRVDCSLQPDDSNYRRTYCGVYATTLGAVCHELGHIFNLGHTKEGVMGFGFDYVSRLFTIDTNTESLPERIFTASNANNNAINRPPRFTQLMPRHQNRFLDKYRKQHIDDDNEDFYFTRNCAVILAYHKWFNRTESTSKLLNTTSSSDCPKVKHELNSGEIIISVEFPLSLKLIEVRTNDNSLVIWYKEFNTINDDNDQYFKLPIKMINYELEKIHLIVMTTNGEIERINFSNK